MVNNETHLTTKMFLFIINYGRKLRMRADIKEKGKVEKATEFEEGARESRSSIEESIEGY